MGIYKTKLITRGEQDETLNDVNIILEIRWIILQGSMDDFSDEDGFFWRKMEIANSLARAWACWTRVWINNFQFQWVSKAVRTSKNLHGQRLEKYIKLYYRTVATLKKRLWHTEYGNLLEKKLQHYAHTNNTYMVK